MFVISWRIPQPLVLELESIAIKQFRRSVAKEVGAADLSAQDSFTTISSAARKSALQTLPQDRYLSWRQIFRPSALALVGLAIAVALWGFGYKLSLYHPDPTPSSQFPVAKLWIEHRNASVTAVSRLKSTSHLIPAPQVFPVPIQRFPHRARANACIFPVRRHTVAYFDFLIPFRSPPPHRFCLA